MSVLRICKGCLKDIILQVCSANIKNKQGRGNPAFFLEGDFMTVAEKNYIIRYRQMGKSCTEIARALVLSVNTVKSFCQRSGIAPIGQATGTSPEETLCLCCGEKIKLQPHRKPKRFCSDACRLRWWHAHRDMEKSAVDRRCLSCGRAFRSSREQKYCSHACYIEARFGGSTHGCNADAKAV